MVLKILAVLDKSLLMHLQSKRYQHTFKNIYNGVIVGMTKEEGNICAR